MNMENRSTQYIPLLSALIGALIGAFSSVGTLVVQNHFQNSREVVFDMAWRDYEIRITHAPKDSYPRAAPFPVILSYHVKMMDLLEKDKLPPEHAKEILDARAEMARALYGGQ